MVKYVVFRLVLQWFWAHITILVPRFLNWEKKLQSHFFSSNCDRILIKLYKQILKSSFENTFRTPSLSLLILYCTSKTKLHVSNPPRVL